eukprot:2071110-Amphidinium_carterae.1
MRYHRKAPSNRRVAGSRLCLRMQYPTSHSLVTGTCTCKNLVVLKLGHVTLQSTWPAPLFIQLARWQRTLLKDDVFDSRHLRFLAGASVTYRTARPEPFTQAMIQ